MGSESAERRKHKRVHLTKEVTINDAIRAQILNLSEGGIYIHTSYPFPVGQSLKISLTPEERAIQARVIVRHCQEGVGAGLSFVDLNREELEVIREVVGSAGEKTEETVEDGKKRVLLVEDSALSRRMNKSRLVLDGFAVFEAADGVEALAALGAEKIDLVVLDLQIPNIDGYKVLSVMRENPAWMEIPVLVCSARSSAEEVERAMMAGATEFLMKITTSPVKLSERIKTRLKDQRAAEKVAGSGIPRQHCLAK